MMLKNCNIAKMRIQNEFLLHLKTIVVAGGSVLLKAIIQQEMSPFPAYETKLVPIN